MPNVRNMGCCAHVATVIYYLSWARWQEKIPRPAEKLTDPYRGDSDSEAEGQPGAPEAE